MSRRRRWVALVLGIGLVAAPAVAAAAPGASSPGVPTAGFTAPLPPLPALSPAPSRTPAAASPAPSPEAAPQAGTRMLAAIASSVYVDTCEDPADAYDIRRAGMAMMDDQAALRFTLRACPDEPSLEDAADGTAFGWQTVTTDARERTFRFIARRVGEGWEVQRPSDNQPVAGATAEVHRARDQAGNPVPGVSELVVEVPVGRFSLPGSCEPASTTGCLQVGVASYPAGGGQPRDTMPDAGMPAPLWPSTCRADLDPAAAGRVRMTTTSVTAASAVAARLRAAGYRADAYDGAPYVEVPAGASAAVVGALRSWEEVTDVTAIAPRQLSATAPDDEPLWDEQWYLRRIGMPQAWDVSTGSGVGIAIVDNGVASDRPDLAGRVGRGYDAFTGDILPAGTHSDLGGHGTAVAGLAAAIGDNGVGMAGVDWRATVHPVRVFDHEGCFATGDDYLASLRWIRDNAGDLGIRVANFSLGGSAIPGEAQLIADIVASGVTVVAAMGNQADATGVAASYPAALPEVIGVGATGPDDRLASYSNRGRHVDVVAPGGDQSGTVKGDLLTLADPTAVGPSLPYAPLAGTSFSTPLVSGIAALYHGRHPSATPADATRALITTARDLGDDLAGFDLSYGFGLVDAPTVLQHRPGQLTTRLAGADRYETAAATSRRAFPDPDLVDVVLVATGESFPDALAGGPLAAREHAPLLLTEGDRLHRATARELARLQPRRVLLLGGESVVSPRVARQLRDRGYTVERAAGSDRYATAETIALGGSGGSWRSWNTADVVYLATGENFPDALPGGAAAAAADAPLLLTARFALPEPTRRALTALRPSRVIVLGGDSAVAPSVVDQVEAMGMRVDRAAGPDRYSTAVAALCPIAELCQTDTRFAVVATGEGFADALGGSAAAAALRAPLLLVPRTGPVPPAVADALEIIRPEQIVVLGGRVPVPQPMVDRLATLVVR